jgi:hypothetical protein
VGGELKLSEALGLLLGGKPGKVAVEQDYVTVDLMSQIQKALPSADIVALSGIPEALRMIKDAEELDAISRALAPMGYVISENPTRNETLWSRHSLLRRLWRKMVETRGKPD